MQANDGMEQFWTWLESIRVLTGSPDDARQWRDRRYQFARRLGEALVGATPDQAEIAGPALYGIWLRWGVLYVGQTTEAGRRLRDLPIGESHHLANTFPPETWDRIVVIAWPKLLEEADLATQIDSKAIGLALEHQLQLRVEPLANAARRMTNGGWRPVDRARSMSLGARTAGQIDALSQRVNSLWDEAAAWAPGARPLPDAIRCVMPGAFLPDSP